MITQIYSFLLEILIKASADYSSLVVDQELSCLLAGDRSNFKDSQRLCLSKHTDTDLDADNTSDIKALEQFANYRYGYSYHKID